DRRRAAERGSVRASAVHPLWDASVRRHVDADVTALLLFHVELHGGLSKNHVGGEVVSVRAADAYVSEEERRLFGIVRVRGDVAKLRAKYLKNGVPDAVAARAAAEHARVFEARSAKGKVRSF